MVSGMGVRVKCVESRAPLSSIGFMVSGMGIRVKFVGNRTPLRWRVLGIGYR